MASGVASAADAPAQVQDKIPLMIVHSQPDLDARLEAAQLRLKENRKYMSYFLSVTHNSDWKKIFKEWPLPYKWPHMNNEEYSKLVIYHLAAQNNGDVGYMAECFLREGRFGDPTNIVALNAFTSKPQRVYEAFSREEIAEHSEAFLLKIFEWHFLTTQQKLEKNLVALNVPHAIISKSTSNSPMLRPAKHRKSKSQQLSIEVPSNVNPHLIVVPPPAGPPPPPTSSYAGDSRRTSSAQVPMRLPIGMRGGDRAVSGPVFDAPTGPKTGPGMGQRPYIPPTPTMSRPPHPLSQQSTPGQMMHPQPAGYPRRDMSTGAVVVNSNMAQFPPPPPAAMRMPSGEFRQVLPHQLPGHIYGHPMPPHPAQHGAMGPPPPPPVGMGLGMSMHSSGPPMSPMQPIQPMYFDPSISRPGNEYGRMLYDPNQPTPPQNRQDFSRPHARNQQSNYGQYVENSRHNNHNNHNNRGRKQSRGGRGGGRGGMQSYDGGRRQSVHAIDRPLQGSIHDSMPPAPPVERAERAHRESFSHARPQDTERFPDFHEQQQESFNIDNIPRELQCLRKFIGSDVEDMDSIWIGNIPHGTSDEMIQSLIEGEVNVAVVNVKPVLVDANKAVGWTIVTFHKTSDARLVLQKLEEFNFRGHLLDVQVPERCRHDLPESKVQSRRSSNKHSVIDGPMPGVPVGPRSSFTRNNSIRQLRTNSGAHSDSSGRRNSLFSPQDARSDIPVLPDLPEVAEAVSAQTDNITPTGCEEGSTTAVSELSISTVMHATAPPFVPPQYNSFGAEISGSTNKHLAVEEQFHRSASSESLRRTSGGYDYEFEFAPNDEAAVEHAIEDDATVTSDSSHPVEVKKSRARKQSSAAQIFKNEDSVAGANDDATLTDESKADPEIAQNSAVDGAKAIHEPSEHANEDVPAVLIEEMPAPAEVSDVVEEPVMQPKDDEIATPSADLPIPAVDVAEEIQNPSIFSTDDASAPSVEVLPVPASEADVETRTESVFSEAPTEMLSDTAGEKAPESGARKSAVPAASIHPFAKPKATNSQRQVSKADKKKVKKQGQAGKKKTEPVSSLIPAADEPEILSLDEIKAKSKVRASPGKLAAATKLETPLTEANVEALSVSVAEASIPAVGAEAPPSTAEENAVVPDIAKAEDVASFSTTAASRVHIVPKTAFPIAYPRKPSQMNRVPSVTVNDLPRKERKPSNASAASDSSFGTPKTAKEYQTPVPSPAPDVTSSPSATPLVAETEEVVQATAGAELEPVAVAQPEVKIEAETEPADIDDSASAQAAIQTNKKKAQKNQKKKRQNRDNKKKNASVDGQDASQPQAEAPPKDVFAKLKDLNPCTGMGRDPSPNADEEASPGLHDDNATPGISSAVTGRDEKSSVAKTASTKTASLGVKENKAGTSLSWAQLLAGGGKSPAFASANVPTKGGLTQRDPNVGQQFTKGG